jgi:outer membrane protein assembly factor BamB
MMRDARLLFALGLVAAWGMAAGNGAMSAVRADEPGGAPLTRFLPPDGNSVYSATGLLRSWPADGPKRLWQVDVGWGKSAVVEAAGLAFTAAETDNQQWAVCLDAATGVQKWKTLLYPKENRHFEWGPVTSPLIDGDRVYYIPYANHEGDVWEMRGPIVCLKTDGSELWRVDETVWGSEASTPLIVGDTLYVGADNPERVVLAALDKMTGAVRWTVKAESARSRELAAPASLTYQVVDGVPQIIVATYGSREVLGVHAERGEIMWRYPYPAEIILGLISTPVAVGNRLLISGGEGKGRNFFACLEMSAKDGTIGYRELYRSTELQTNMYNTVAVYNDAVFGFGGGQRMGFLQCTNLADGRLLWSEESEDWTKDQQLVIADGLLLAVTKGGELVLAEASRERYQELARFRLDLEVGRPQQPTIANGRLYIRGSREIACYQIAP